MYSEGMDDVTSKVAYAYAKQQAFVYLALAFLALGALGAGISLEGLRALGLARGELLASGAGLVAAAALLAGGVEIVRIVRGRTNLAAVNRPSLRRTLVVGLVLLLVALDLALVAPVALHLPSPIGLRVFALAAFLVAAVAAGSYVFPITRGDKVLYGPAEVRALSNRRTLGFANGLGLALALTLLFARRPGALAGPLLPGLLGAPLLTVAAVVGFAAYLALPGRSGDGIGQIALAAFAGIGLAWFVGLLPRGAPTAAVALAPVLLALLYFPVRYGLSAPLNRGKKIIAHRA